jgi:Leucine-rich repeat (LRR) protein
MISGLSFSLPLPSDGSNDSDENVDDGGAGMLSNLVGSLPPWISCLTFDGVLSNSEMETLVKVLKTVGLLTAGLVIHKGATSDKDDQRQGRFGCLAIRNSTKIEKGVWRSLFRLLGRTDGSAVSEPPRPLARLKVLDLSGNKLGDELCAAVLLLAHDRGSGCMLEELDLSGNCINAATHMLKVLREYLLHHRHKHHSGGKRSKSRWKSHLHTLLLAANGLQEDRAWLKMVDLLKGDALELEVLDLSDNGLVLGDHDDDLCGSLSSALLKNTCLRRLNLSRNKFSPLAVDRLLCDLDAATNSVLSFVEFHDNEPAFSENQLRLLASFVGRSRQNLLQRVMSADQDDAGRSVDWKPGDADISVAEGAVSVSSVPRDSAMNPEVAMRDNMITVLFSAPLIYRRTDEIIMPFEKLDFAKEREILWQCLKEASLEGSDEINLVFDTATTDRLLAVITKRCSCLHYSGTFSFCSHRCGVSAGLLTHCRPYSLSMSLNLGHGFTDRLPFEMAGEKFGQPDWQHVDMIRRLISQGDGAAFRFVFVSACFSFSMGAAFVKAGVPHVVCCDEGAALKDSAALLFTRQFYLSLALGSTVKASFDQGCKAVLAQHPEEEMRKFRLLPEGDRLHDESIFPSTGRRSRRGSHRAPHAAGTKALDLRVQNKIQEDPGPSPPECFLGREVDMYHVLARLMDKSNRLVSVYGVPGVGRASLVKALCHYINERASTIDFKQIYYVKASREKRAVALMRRLMNLLIQADKLSGDTAPASAASHDHSDIEIITDLVCRSLKSERVLIVFERVDLLEDADEFPITLKTLLSETRSLKVLLTNRQRLGIASIAEKYFELGPLTLGNTVHLFAQKCQNLHTRQERHRLVEALLAEADQVDLLPGADDLTDSSARIFSCMGFGIPSLIERAAYSISKEVFLSMMNGSFLEPDNQAAAVGVEEIPDDGHSAA